ncbi:MAG: DUF2520 domain-containing protein [Gordonia sp. (in: high G+C Gram-positive bacteria)]
MTAPITPPRLNVGIVSAGRVGCALGEALASAGHRVVDVHARSEVSRRRAADRLPGVPVAALSDVVAAADLIVVAVPDTALDDVVAQIAEVIRPGQLVAHTAGAHGVAVLEPIARRGAVVMAVHPAMTFVGDPEDTERLASACFGITSADEIGDAIAASLVLEIGGTPVRIAESERTRYHAALALGANNLIALIADAVAALEAAIAGPDGRADLATVDGPSTGLAERVLAPLARASLDNVLDRGIGALTGPVARDDVDTVRRHLGALETLPDAGIAESYRVLAARAAARSGASPEMIALLEASR